MNEVTPWSVPVRAAVKSAWISMTTAVSGWGIGGAFIAVMAMIVGLYVFQAAYLGHHEDTGNPCHDTSALVKRVDQIDSSQYGHPLHSGSARELRAMGPQFAVAASRTRGDEADLFTQLARRSDRARAWLPFYAGDLTRPIALMCALDDSPQAPRGAL